MSQYWLECVIPEGFSGNLCAASGFWTGRVAVRADEAGRVRGEKVTPEGLGPRACLIPRPNFGPLASA